jgi:hypothetical protein
VTSCNDSSTRNSAARTEQPSSAATSCSDQSCRPTPHGPTARLASAALDGVSFAGSVETESRTAAGILENANVPITCRCWAWANAMTFSHPRASVSRSPSSRRRSTASPLSPRAAWNPVNAAASSSPCRPAITRSAP